ncbi:hypothetical protein BDA99DRAFT_536705 [Phascolomyces articulosus]|uniref:Uncharacterized protein n=1 Tax=Phascolomyces articulosus TaxID=60185 RepID=A0AAD5PGQ2_9FUNG|nr:hypothetical protein BDA99DRAFT_536705 [Phascolomyces articulosus]
MTIDVIHVTYFTFFFFIIVLIYAHLVIPYILDVELLTYFLNDAFKWNMLNMLFIATGSIIWNNCFNGNRGMFTITGRRNDPVSAFIDTFGSSYGFIDKFITRLDPGL